MTDTNILKLLKKSAGNCSWSYKGGKFIGKHKNRGMATYLDSTFRRYEIIAKAQSIQRELIAARKGTLDDETEKLWER